MRKLKNSELDRLNVDEFKSAEKTPVIIILDNIRSLNNIGSVFRTSDAFLIKKIYLCGITATPPHNDIRKTALGSTETVDWEYVENTIELVKKLKTEGIKVVSIEQAENATLLHNFTPQPNTTYALVFGNEVKGVAQNVVDASDVVIEIPQFGTKHSLNISVSCGVVIWDVFSKLKTLSLLFFLFLNMSSCNEKVKSYDLTGSEKTYLKRVIDSMYELDQGVRHGFGKIDSLYGLEDGFMMKRHFEGQERLGNKLEDYNKQIDSIWSVLKQNDSLNSRLLINLTKQYGFPNNKRLDVYRSKAYFLFVHAPKQHFEEITTLINKEYEAGRISEYKKGYIFWHINGRKGLPPMNGENGKAIWID